MNRKISFLVLLLFGSFTFSYSQNIFQDGFNDGDVSGWFAATDRSIFYERESKLIVEGPMQGPNNESVFIPQIGSVGDVEISLYDFKFLAQGIALFKASGNSYIATFIEGDSINVIFKNHDDPVEYHVFTKKLNIPAMQNISNWNFSIANEDTAYRVELTFADSINYSTPIINIDPIMSQGLSGIYIWGDQQYVEVDSAEIKYEPLGFPSNYKEDFNNNGKGWFVINDYTTVEFNGGELHLSLMNEDPENISTGTIWVVPPVNPFEDGYFESWATGEVRGFSGAARVNGNHYIVTMFIEDSVFIGYNDAFPEDHDAFILTGDSIKVKEQEYHKFKMEFVNTDTSIIVKSNLDSLTFLEAEIINPSSGLRRGLPIMVFEADTVDWRTDWVKFNFNPITNVENDGETIPGKFELFQNYPNPFNPSTVINYSLPQNAFVRLEVFDLLGNIVTTLVNEYQNAGLHQINFNASNLSSGIYFYNISVSLMNKNINQTKKMMLI
ncbi:MAG: T9SS C-terminal target domain-containing protein, partial [Ignavibacteria bacterium]